VAADGTRLLTAGELWLATKAALADVVAQTKTGSAAGQIAAICASSFGESFIAVDSAGETICDPMIFTDRWGEEEYADMLICISPEEIAQICGLPLSPCYSLPKILYLMREKPRTFKRIHKILFISSYITWMLSGETVVDYSLACRTMLFDVNSCDWSERLLWDFGQNRRHYPEILPMGTAAGVIRPGLAAEIGLPTGTLVVVGGHDQPVNAIGAGFHAGFAVNSMGTSECVTPITGARLSDDFIIRRNTPTEALWQRGLHCCLVYNVTSGLLLQWFAGILGDGGVGINPADLAHLDAHVPPEPTRIMVQPYLMGSGTPYLDTEARLALTGLDYGTTRYDIYRAMLEGLCLDQRLNLEGLAAEGVEITHLIAVGGGSKSRPWLQIKADILGMPVSTPEVRECGALGSAILCATACRAYDSIPDAAAAMSRIKETFEPSGVYADFYAEKFDLYTRLHTHVCEESMFAVSAPGASEQ
jgi:xylulokinase